MCVLCDGGTEEELQTDRSIRIAVHGFTMVQVEGVPSWTYTIGLARSFDHPELVVTGLPDGAPDLINDVVDRIRDGERFDASSPPMALCDCASVAFGAVHREQWVHGRFDQWLDYYDRLGEKPLIPDVVQVLWPDKSRLFPTDPDFCPEHRPTCQPLLDVAPHHNVHIGPNREERRRAKRGHGNRRRP